MRMNFEYWSPPMKNKKGAQDGPIQGPTQGKRVVVKHISWFTRKDYRSDGIILCEVVEASYRHPGVPNHLFLKGVEIKVHGSVNRTSKEAASLILLEASLEVVSQLDVVG